MRKWQIFLLSLFISSPILAQDAAPLSTNCATTTPAANLVLDTSLGYAEAIQTYLSAGGDPAQLKPLLQAAGVLPSSDMSEGVYIIDLTGDGINDVVVNITFPAEQPLPVNNFVIWIYVCDSTSYHQVYEDDYWQVSTALDHGMYVDTFQDLNHDSRPEVIYTSVSCGVNNCFEHLHITGWNNLKQMHSVLNEIFYLGDYTFEDNDGDGIYDIIITTGVSGSGGAGPQRRWQITYGWDGINFSQRRSVPEAPRFGFQAIEDAVRALNAGDLQTAAILYQKILDGDTFSRIEERTDAITTSQALFGLLVIRTVQGDRETAAELYAELQNFPGIPGINNSLSESLWVKVGRTFYQSLQGYNFNEACDAVIAELNAALESERQSPGTDTTYWGNFGRRPMPEDVCPF